MAKWKKIKTTQICDSVTPIFTPKPRLETCKNVAEYSLGGRCDCGKCDLTIYRCKEHKGD